jgi:hypothetical protein
MHFYDRCGPVADGDGDGDYSFTVSCQLVAMLEAD